MKEVLLAKKILLLDAWDEPFILYDPEMDSNHFMWCASHYPHKYITVKYGDAVIGAFNAQDYDYLRKGVMHEMMHVVLGEFDSKTSTPSSKKELTDSLEATTDHLTNIVLRLKEMSTDKVHKVPKNYDPVELKKKAAKRRSLTAQKKKLKGR